MHYVVKNKNEKKKKKKKHFEMSSAVMEVTVLPPMQVSCIELEFFIESLA